LLSACAHQPIQAKADHPVVIDTTPAPPPLTGPAASAAAAAAAQPGVPSGATPITPPADGSADTSANPAASSDLNGPPSNSLVTAKPADLFQRIRNGFKLQDVDEPAVDSQVNWLANHPDFLSRTWGRAGLWLYYIVGQLEQRNMPTELALLPVIESAFEPYAYSRASAAGLWQFISDTGRRFGLKQDWWYDGRRDPIAATNAALDYLQTLHDEFGGDWLLAVAAYNCGELLVSRSIQRNQRLGLPTDFWHLRLPRETRGYVPELLAMRRLVENPGRYDLDFTPIPDTPYFVTVTTPGPVSLAVVAQLTGVSIDDLYELNPAFLRPQTDPEGPYRVLVPTDAAEGLQQTLAQLTPDERLGVMDYAVQRHDSVASIARQFNTSPEEIRELNKLDPHARLVEEVSLKVPARQVELPEKVERAALLADHPRRFRRGRFPVIHIVHRGDTLYSLARRLNTNVRTLEQLNGLSPGEPLRAGQRLRVRATLASTDRSPRSRRSSRQRRGSHGVASPTVAAEGSRQLKYVVRRGDTLYGIARLLQVTVADLLSWNDMAGAHDLRPGQVLVAFVKSRS
jgi:membrane-bound lytic murein transglycosylase D